MHKMITAAAAAAALFAASAASAATLDFQFDNANSSVNVTNNPTACIFGSCPLNAQILTPFSNLSLNAGQSATFDFAQFTIGNGFGSGSADLDATLAFTLPTAGPASTTGSGSYFHTNAVWIFPSTTTGSLSWADPVQQFTATDGSVFTVQFNDLKGFKVGDSVTDTVTITADSIAAGVPEPGVWAMLIIGLGMIGTALRRKPSKAPLAA
jgi:hypothetical protein